ncbi:LA_0442/LA_0875 N-terminal domain-containing protein [Leptospira sp. GIMC2001]|uniref:LA_0442/LA_0875 N-terminal domain-containing protein n=1 Tax=Leptospira sp. GIMC2001 TaxID=1513297 RepID=UPI00234A4DEE|nr:hypothetical protein [Leptospira sp. GIMC2001]WCL48412.1 hypothetical protein O4O04_14000 [Leptospira sp. GIMC2001]
MKFHFLIFISIISSFAIRAEVILLKSGKYLSGKVSSIDSNKVIFQNQKGEQLTLEKSNVDKIIYKDGSDLYEIIEMEKQKLKIEFENEKSKIREEEKLKYEKNLETESVKTSNETQLNGELASPERSFTTSNIFYSPGGNAILLAGPNGTCSIEAEKKQWFAIFGSIPINRIDSKDLFPSKGEYRVHLKATALDVVVTIFIGFFTTITVRTVVVEKCKSLTLNLLDVEEYIASHKYKYMQFAESDQKIRIYDIPIQSESFR